MRELDILIPVYNEGENILSVLKSLDQTVKTPFHILICYDQDTDNTLPAVRSYKPHNFSVEFVKNEGKGVHAAVMSGFKRSAAPAVFLIPADDDYNAGIVDQIYAKFKEGNDLVAA